jgi:hypothetical protein
VATARSLASSLTTALRLVPWQAAVDRRTLSARTLAQLQTPHKKLPTFHFCSPGTSSTAAVSLLGDAVKPLFVLDVSSRLVRVALPLPRKQALHSQGRCFPL